MKLLRICLKREDEKYLAELNRLLHKNFEILSDLKIGSNIYIQKEDDRFLVSCQFWTYGNYDIERIEKIITATSRSVAEFIVEYKEKEIFEDILEQEQNVIEASQHDQMIQYIKYALHGGDEEGKQRIESQTKRIATKVEEYFWAENQLSLEGFIRFRLKEYWEDWRSLIEYAKEEYLMEKEFSDYIDSQKNLVTKQEAKLNLLHIVHLDDRNLLLFDQEWKRLYPYLVNGITLEMGGRQIRYEDLVLGAIISMAPKLLVIHSNQENHNIIYTIKRIFEEKVQVCSECKDCKGKRSAR